MPAAKPQEDRYFEQRSQQLDLVLRKINKIGLHCLPRADLAFLERVSGELRHELGLSRFEDLDVA